MPKSKTKEEVEIVYRDPKELKPNPNNPRSKVDKGFIHKLAGSFKVHGIIEPVEIDENKEIIRGSTRVLAAIEAGMKIPTRTISGLTPIQKFYRHGADHTLKHDWSTMDKFWYYITGVAMINSGKSYTIIEIKEMYKRDRGVLLSIVEPELKYDNKGIQKGQGTSELSRQIGVSQPSIDQYTQVLKAGPLWVDALEKGSSLGKLLSRIRQSESLPDVENIPTKKEEPEGDDYEITEPLTEEQEIDSALTEWNRTGDITPKRQPVAPTPEPELSESWGRSKVLDEAWGLVSKADDLILNKRIKEDDGTNYPTKQWEETATTILLRLRDIEKLFQQYDGEVFEVRKKMLEEMKQLRGGE